MTVWGRSAELRSVLGRSEVPRIAVVGGGITGLAAAHRLVELGAARRTPVEPILIEALDRLGGTIATEYADGYLVEGGPDAFLTEKPWAVDLCTRLGLGERLIPTQPGRRRTLVLRGRRLLPLPDGFQLLAPSRLIPLWRSPVLSWRGKLRATTELLLPRRRSQDDESVGEFVVRRFGREVLERMVQPLVTGIYVADPSAVSLRATMPRFAEMERAEGSVIRALRRSASRREVHNGSGPRWSLFTAPAGGMQELVVGIAQRLPASLVKLRRRVTSLAQAGGARSWRVNLADGATLLVDGVILALPGPKAARLTSGLDPALSEQLAAIRYHSSAVVTLGYDRSAIRHRLDAFGFVVPRLEGRPILACSFSSLKFAGRAPDGSVLLRVFVGGEGAAEVLARDDADLARVTQQHLREILGISSPPGLVRVHRHMAAMPQYDVGHLEHVEAIRDRVAQHPGLAVCGNALTGVGIPDCIHSGEQAAEQALESTSGLVRPPS